MYGELVYSTLTGNAELVSLLSEYSGEPSIFERSAPEGVPFRYVVYRIDKHGVDGAISRYNLVIDLFDFGLDATGAHRAVVIIENLFKYKTFHTEQLSNIRHFEADIIPVPEPDHRAIHYSVRIEARATEKQWLESLT